MTKILVSFAIILAFSFAAAAQFTFRSSDGTTFGVTGPPDHRDPRGGGMAMEYYYRVEGSDLVVYEVFRTKDPLDGIKVIKVPIDSIKVESFTVRDFAGMFYLQTGRPYTRYDFPLEGNPERPYSESNLQLNFKTREAAEAFRSKVVANFSQEKQDEEVDKALGDLDLSLEDKPAAKKEKPTKFFALFGDGGGRRSYRYDRKNDEVWDYTSNSVFQVGKLQRSGEDLQMLDETGSFFVYALKPIGESTSFRLFNGDRATSYSLIAGVICKSIGANQCETVYRISRDEDKVYRVISGSATEAYRIYGEASDEEVAIMVALLEKLR